MNPDVLFWLAVVGLAATAFVSIGARSLRQFSRHELQAACGRRKMPGRFGEILRRHEVVAQGAETLTILFITLTVIASTCWFALTWWPALLATTRSPWAGLLVGTLGMGTAVTAAKLWIPWPVASLWAEPLLVNTWPLWQVVSWLMAPWIACARTLDVLLHRLAGREREVPTEETLEEEIRTIVTEGHREGLLEEEAREMIEGVMELGDSDVSEIMTPRTDMHMLRVDLPWEELVSQVIKMGHTRIPVFDKNRDDVVGVLHSKDLLPELAPDQPQPPRPLRQILRKPYFVPETKAVNDLLEEFQQTRMHLAVVLDEYGGVSGIVTIEDVLEEIVGEIVDEYDKDLVQEIKQTAEFEYEVLGKAHVDEINQQLQAKLPEDSDFDTIGGFVFSELGRIPRAGETLTWRDAVRITVLEATGRRIERLKIELLDQEAKEIA